MRIAPGVGKRGFWSGVPSAENPIDSRYRCRRLCGAMAKLQRALLSVSDKTGLVVFAQALAAAGIELISTGGTAKALREAGLTVKDISEHTGFPEMLDGRVKTLHPKVHGGLLYIRGNAAHESAAQQHGITPIDLVVVNLYPFEATVAKPNVSLHDAIENIDIGGPSMLRSAAKNHDSVTVVVDPMDYAEVAEQIAAGDARITGLMIESHLEEGRQDIVPGQPLQHGVSVTDACISFAQTVPVLEQLAAAVRTRRAKNKA